METKTATYKMPAVEVGQTVQWMADRGVSPAAGIVVCVAPETIDLVFYGSNGDATEYGLKSGVRHAGDPKAQSAINGGNGIWRHTELTRLVQEMVITER